MYDRMDRFKGYHRIPRLFNDLRTSLYVTYFTGSFYSSRKILLSVKITLSLVLYLPSDILQVLTTVTTTHLHHICPARTYLFRFDSSNFVLFDDMDVKKNSRINFIIEWWRDFSKRACKNDYAKGIFRIRRSGIKTNEALVFRSSTTIQRNVKRPHFHFESRNFPSGYVQPFERENEKRFQVSVQFFLLNTALKSKVWTMKTSSMQNSAREE